jgi:hypothetical protein
MDPVIWEEKFKTNPDSSKFYVYQIRGMEEMTQRYLSIIFFFFNLFDFRNFRYKALRDNFCKVEETLRANRERIDKLKNLSASEIGNNVK